VEDQELLERVRAGDRGAFDTIFRTYYAPLVRLAERLLRERAVAEEVVQDVMLELWRRRETFSLEDSLRVYLYRAARNRALNHLRHLKVERRGEPHVIARASAAPRADADLAEEELRSAVTRALDALPVPTREVFDMSRVGGLRYNEIAEALGISVKTVEARMGRALRALREELAPWLPAGAKRGERG
jgi:RNA polymerase sigma-70 factor (ECF subfamily)